MVRLCITLSRRKRRSDHRNRPGSSFIPSFLMTSILTTKKSISKATIESIFKSPPPTRHGGVFFHLWYDIIVFQSTWLCPLFVIIWYITSSSLFSHFLSSSPAVLLMIPNRSWIPDNSHTYSTPSGSAILYLCCHLIFL
jgi:hypothetical protein